VFVAEKKLDKPWIVNRIHFKSKEVGRTGAVRAAKARHYFGSDGRNIPGQPALQVKPGGNGECANWRGLHSTGSRCAISAPFPGSCSYGGPVAETSHVSQNPRRRITPS
jgi:hypothetical protein